jgi:hypothetical protein
VLRGRRLQIVDQRFDSAAHIYGNRFFLGGGPGDAAK